MSAAATIAKEFFGSLAASLVLRCAYSAAVMPGVTREGESESVQGRGSIRSPGFKR